MLYGECGALSCCAKRGDGGIDGEVHTRCEHAGGDQRHDCDQRLGEHRAVADQLRVSLAGQQLRRGAAGDQCMEAADRAAGDGDEHEWKHLAAEHRAAAVNELRHGGHRERRHHKQNADCQRQHNTDLHERTQVVARREQQPDGKNAGGKAVPHDQQRECRSAQCERWRQCGVGGHPLAGPQCAGQHDETDRTGFEHFVGPQILQVEAHENRDRNGQRDGHRAPRARLERVDNHQRQYGDQHDHDAKHCNECGDAGHRPDLVLRHLTERASVATHR